MSRAPDKIALDLLVGVTELLMRADSSRESSDSVVITLGLLQHLTELLDAVNLPASIIDRHVLDGVMILNRDRILRAQNRA